MIPCAYIFDIDGTLADCSHRLHFIQQEKPDWDSFYKDCVNDKPIAPTVELLRALVDSDPTEITTSPWVISQLLCEKYTTVYRGIKFYFENGATLKKFCDLIENKGVKNEQ